MKTRMNVSFLWFAALLMFPVAGFAVDIVTVTAVSQAGATQSAVPVVKLEQT
ncbi:MAG: hypothetical protein L3J22_05045 [Xanthomonadales bacterium]|nr:hypothetical protein [Xanthomonadales bacterium]